MLWECKTSRGLHRERTVSQASALEAAVPRCAPGVDALDHAVCARTHRGPGGQVQASASRPCTAPGRPHTPQSWLRAATAGASLCATDTPRASAARVASCTDRAGDGRTSGRERGPAVCRGQARRAASCSQSSLRSRGAGSAACKTAGRAGCGRVAHGRVGGGAGEGGGVRCSICLSESILGCELRNSPTRPTPCTTRSPHAPVVSPGFPAACRAAAASASRCKTPSVLAATTDDGAG